MQHISNSLRRTLFRAIQEAPVADQLQMAWRVVAGSAVAERTELRGIERGRLVIAVQDRSWAAQLATMAPQYLAHFAGLLPGSVKEIRFEVSEST